MEISSFARILNKLQQKSDKLDTKLRYLKLCIDNDNMRTAYEQAAALEEISEQLVLLARSLPAYTGRPSADKDIRSIMKKSIPVFAGFTEEGWFSLRIPSLLPKKSKGSAEYIRSFLYPFMREFFSELPPIRYTDCVLIYRHIYDRTRPDRRKRDHDNIELNMVSDIVALYVMPDDGPSVCSHYYCSAEGNEDRTEVYVIDKNDFILWLNKEKSMPESGIKLYEKPP